MSERCLLRATALTKTYGAMTALSEASIQIVAGEVRALVGANGAGKSTLVKLLTGAVLPSGGTIEVDGSIVEGGDPQAMLQRGIACIYQHSHLAPALSVLDNIFLGRQPTRGWGILDRRRQRAEAAALLEKYQISLDLDAIVSDLATVKQKEVEIAKALALDARILLMDEPTAWLSHSEVRKLFQTIRALKAAGVGIVYISHILDEIFMICDTVTILRDGKVVADCAIAEMTRQKLLQAFIGGETGAEASQQPGIASASRESGEARLVCEHLAAKGAFEDISFEVHAGEILCITGLIGSGRTEVVRAIFGADRFDSGRVLVAGKLLGAGGPSSAIRRGIGFVPEDRHRDGLMLNMSISHNLVMSCLHSVAKLGLLLARKVSEVAWRQVRKLSIVPAAPATDVGKLSGGNQQKVLIGKWLHQRPEILILDEPTVGVDVHAKSEIYAVLRALRAEGTALLVVSSDMEEVMAIADRILVMCNGKVQGIYDAASVNRHEIIAHVGGE